MSIILDLNTVCQLDYYDSARYQLKIRGVELYVYIENEMYYRYGIESGRMNFCIDSTYATIDITINGNDPAKIVFNNYYRVVSLDRFIPMLAMLGDKIPISMNFNGTNHDRFYAMLGKIERIINSTTTTVKQMKQNLVAIVNSKKLFDIKINKN
jgi:hypothetical protein